MAGFFECQHLSVFDSCIPVKTPANNNAILHNNGAHQRVGSHLTFTFGRERKREIEKAQIVLSAARSLTQLK
jgi:hypothetical protein